MEQLRLEYSTLCSELQQLSRREDSSGLAGPTPSSNLEQQCEEAERQLERYKRATKRHVQDFREGVHLLLGWKVDLTGSRDAVRWHLTSKYQEGQELIFGRSPEAKGEAKPGAEASLD